MYSLLVYVLSNYSEGQDSSLLLTINMWLLSKDKWVYLCNRTGWLNTGIYDWWSRFQITETWIAITEGNDSFKTESKFSLYQVRQVSVLYQDVVNVQTIL